jgi:hypothetical protein
VGAVAGAGVGSGTGVGAGFGAGAGFGFGAGFGAGFGEAAGRCGAGAGFGLAAGRPTRGRAGCGAEAGVCAAARRAAITSAFSSFRAVCTGRVVAVVAAGAAWTTPTRVSPPGTTSRSGDEGSPSSSPVA